MTGEAVGRGPPVSVPGSVRTGAEDRARPCSPQRDRRCADRLARSPRAAGTGAAAEGPPSSGCRHVPSDARLGWPTMAVARRTRGAVTRAAGPRPRSTLSATPSSTSVRVNSTRVLVSVGESSDAVRPGSDAKFGGRSAFGMPDDLPSDTIRRPRARSARRAGVLVGRRRRRGQPRAVDRSSVPRRMSAVGRPWPNDDPELPEITAAACHAGSSGARGRRRSPRTGTRAHRCDLAGYPFSRPTAAGLIRNHLTLRCTSGHPPGPGRFHRRPFAQLDRGARPLRVAPASPQAGVTPMRRAAPRGQSPVGR